MKSISLLAVFVLLGLVLWLGSARDGGAPAVTTAAGSADPGGEAVVTVTGLQRELVADEDPAEVYDSRADASVAAARTSPTPGPWWLRIRVVDERGLPVADAEVRLFEGSVLKDGSLYAGRKGGGATMLRTDAAGRAEHRARLPAVSVSARKPGIGASNRFRLDRAIGVAEELELVLETPLLLRGVVRGADGSPLHEARVTAECFGICRPVRGKIAKSDDVTSDEHGRFAIPVRLGGRYRLTATVGGESTMPAHVAIVDRSPAEIELMLPGAITVGGVVSDPNGLPVAGARVVAWRDVDFAEKLEVVADDGGGFRLPLPAYDGFRVVAMASGWASSDAIVVVPNAVRAHVQVGLRLQAFADIRGRVSTEDGAPIVGAEVEALPLDEREVLGTSEPDPTVRFGRPAATRSGEGGQFVLAVHPGAQFTVEVRAADFEAVQRGVRPGRGEVRFVLGATSCLVRGVVTRADGHTAPDYEVFVVRRNGPMRLVSKVEPDRVGASFTCPLPSRGDEVTVRVVPADPLLAPAAQGPFATDGAEVALTFRLAPWGSVPIEVVDSEARPVAGARVVLDPLDGATEAVGGWTDDHGRMALERVGPGRSRLRAFPPGEEVVEREVTVLPGVNGTLLVTLPPQ